MAYIPVTVRTDQESGVTGFIIEKNLYWFNNSDKYSVSSAIAHDVFDHFLPDQRGTVENELVALGALMQQTDYTRHLSYAQRRSVSPEKDFAMNFGATLNDYFSDNKSFELETCNYNGKIDKKLQAIVNDSILSADSLDYIHSICKDEELDSDLIISSIKNEKENIVKWVYFGFNESRKRFRKFDPWDITLTRLAVDKAGMDMTDIQDYENYTLVYNINNNSARFVMHLD